MHGLVGLSSMHLHHFIVVVVKVPAVLLFVMQGSFSSPGRYMPLTFRLRSYKASLSSLLPFR